MSLRRAQYVPSQQSWLVALGVILTLLISGCGSPSPVSNADSVTPPTVNLNDAPIVGALYQGQIPGLGLIQWDLRNHSDAGDIGTPHTLGMQTVETRGETDVDKDGKSYLMPLGAKSDWDWRETYRDKANSILPLQFDLELENGLPGTHVIFHRIAVFRQWKGRFRDETADFPVFEDNSSFHRQVTARLAADARDFAADADDEQEANSPGFADETVDFIFCTNNLVSVAITGTGAGGSSSMWGVVHNFVNDSSRARELSLAELFLPGSGWEKKLSDFCITDLFRQYGPYDPTSDPKLNVTKEPEDELAPFGVLDGTIKNFTPTQLSNFNVMPAGLVIELSSIDVGGGKGADCSVTIPWPELRGYLRTEGPARFLTDLAPAAASK